MTMDLRMLGPGDVEAYIAHLDHSNAESGQDGAPHSHAYGRDQVWDLDAAATRERERWATAVTDVTWRRAWGLFDGEQLVGHLQLAGGEIPSETHRVDLGMGILASHHRQGGGRRLLDSALAWAREQPPIDWIDLGVFTDNAPAQALYVSAGFDDVGIRRDRYRVDGRSLDERVMTLFVGS
jgi:RimJ/RimL family protein N-acetyltransferase